MKIGFDLDKVFIDNPPFIPKEVISKLYIKKANGTLEYRIPSVPEQYVRRLSHFPLFRPPIKENITFLKKISREHNQIYLISSRFGFLEEVTKDLVNKYGLSDLFDGLYFNFENKQPHIFKDEILKKLQLDIYIDDDFHLLDYLAKRNKDTQFFWLDPQTKVVSKVKNVKRISHLSEIFS